MLKSEIKTGTDHAVREKRMRGFPFQRLRIVEHVRGNKWKAKWIDPNAGLVDYIESGQLIVPWREHKAFLKEEASEDRLREHNARHGYSDKNSPVITALEQVFESVGDGTSFRDGSLVGSPEAIERLWPERKQDLAKNRLSHMLTVKAISTCLSIKLLSLGTSFAQRNHQLCLSRSKPSNVSGRIKQLTGRNIYLSCSTSTAPRGRSFGNGQDTMLL
jgi:hypothetical protein